MPARYRRYPSALACGGFMVAGWLLAAVAGVALYFVIRWLVGA